MTAKKIAVLGGGTGSLAAVWALTTLPAWQERYDITVYQMGWRLGGKGASGRNHREGQRIEEHGLHVWAGFYENAFRVMRSVYGAWEPGPDSPIQTWRDAFHPQNDVIVEELVNGQWRHWELEWPPAPGTPGDLGPEPPDVWGYIVKLLEWLHDVLTDSPVYDEVAVHTGGAAPLWSALTGGDHHPEITPETPERRGIVHDLISSFSPPQLVRAARDFAAWLQPDPAEHFGADQLAIIKLLEGAFAGLEQDFQGQLDERDDARRLYCMLDMGLGTIRGLIMDGVIFRGFDAIDIWEWSNWMRRWGVSEYTLNSVAVRGLYDYVFGFPGGNFAYPSVGAGSAIHGALRLVFTYKEAMFFYMQAGMGDIVFSPLYMVLKERGVKFKFFHKVENLGLDQTTQQVTSISIARQATLKQGAPQAYDPLVQVKGVWSWPSEPRYEQLVEGGALEARRINLESNWAKWTPAEQLTLKKGEDFDQIILGIPPTSFPFIAPELLAANDRFRHMAYGLGSCQTQAVQLWFNDDAATLGAPREASVVTAYVDPINTWADMTHLIKREEWSQGEAPKFVAYFCGPMEDARHIPDFDDHGFPARELERVKQMAIQWFASHTGHIFNHATLAADPCALDYAKLHGSGSGEARFLGQYFRANIDPSERYILSVPGSTALRLKADESGFGNVFLTGDWTYTSISAGCIECAVMAGLHCAEAVSGQTFRITDRGY